MSEGAGRSAEPSGPSARGAGECPGRSAGPQATPGFERGQAAPPWGREETFFSRLHSARSRPQNGQECIGPHREGHMAVPACPAAHLIMVQAHLACGGFKAALHGPSGARHPPDSRQGGLLGGKDPRRGQLRGGADTAPDQQPAAPVWLQGLGHGQPVPVIPPWTFRAIARTQPRPAGLRRAARIVLT